jgi:hypothetical protein
MEEPRSTRSGPKSRSLWNETGALRGRGRRPGADAWFLSKGVAPTASIEAPALPEEQHSRLLATGGADGRRANASAADKHFSSLSMRPCRDRARARAQQEKRSTAGSGLLRCLRSSSGAVCKLAAGAVPASAGRPRHRSCSGPRMRESWPSDLTTRVLVPKQSASLLKPRLAQSLSSSSLMDGRSAPRRSSQHSGSRSWRRVQRPVAGSHV